MRIHARQAHETERGQSLIEFAMILPVLLILALAIVDFSRAILFNNIIVNMSREGANLAARSILNPQFVISALVDTAAPLDMVTKGSKPGHGMVYITRIAGVTDGKGGVLARVEQMSRSNGGDTALPSRLWNCASWAGDGNCNVPAATASRIIPAPMPLALGDEIHVVETIYDYSSIVRYVMSIAPDLYARTIL